MNKNSIYLATIMKSFLLLTLFIFFISNAQTSKLNNTNLIKYYKLINEAENKIISNDLTSANNLYKEVFKEFKYPHAKDLQNNMKVALKIKDMETAYASYQSLKCLGREFENNFEIENFKNTRQYKATPYENRIDLEYKKTLDSLFEIDQYYRKLSGGNYQLYKKELTRNDSIASTNLLKIIQKKGFPNEYNIDLASADKMFYQKFYYIIWHQLANNLYSSQKVNFSNELIKGLNQGKIRPDIAGHLLDLNNGSSNYSYFKIYQFISNNGKFDCCYISRDFIIENRTDKSLTRIKDINIQRQLLGLSTTEEEVRKNIFFLNNKDYVFSNIAIEGFNFQNQKDIDKFKSYMIKLDDIYK